MRLALPTLLLAALAAPAHAAESYDSCTGTISTLPATLTTQGTWCLQGDLSTIPVLQDVAGLFFRQYRPDVVHVLHLLGAG